METPLISLTSKAADQVKAIKSRENRPQALLRVSVVGGGCSGLSYKLSFEDSAGEKDKVFDLNGVQVAVDPKSVLFLKGIELDFTDGLNGQGFVFNNPNAKSSCGCGSSFSA
jgi:iron-sulfur cluster assembly accessory protein